VIQVDDLEFCYPDGEFVLRVPSLRIPEGSTTAFVGPSGSGKTTLLNLVAGIVTPRTGRVRTNGVEVGRFSDAERREFRIRHVGLVFQEFELLDYLSVLDNILLPYRITPALDLDAAVRARAERLATAVDIGDKLRRYPGQLSQGERQRVAICRAVLTEPPLLLADEPTGNLDPANTERVLEILFGYARGSGATLVAVTHDRELIPRFQRQVDFNTFLDAAPREPTNAAERATP
jgi:ABC-type lipoprotein export system ATPase subunit